MIVMIMMRRMRIGRMRRMKIILLVTIYEKVLQYMLKEKGHLMMLLIAQNRSKLLQLFLKLDM